MAAVKILCYAIFAYGVSNMVVYARGPFALFEKWRGFAARVSDGFGELFSCMICFPTWVGLVSSVIDLLYKGFDFTPFHVLFGASAPWWLVVGMDACFTSGLVWAFDQVVSAFERYIAVYDENNTEDGER